MERDVLKTSEKRVKKCDPNSIKNVAGTKNLWAACTLATK
jgi:hypothetical protein